MPELLSHLEVVDKTQFTQRWSALAGSSQSLVVAELARHADAPVVVITADAPSLHRWQKELQHWLTESNSQMPVLALPEWETLPYDNFSPHQDIISERLRTLYQLPRMARGILLVTASSVLLKVPPRAYIEQNSLVIAKGEQRNLIATRNLFEQAGYRNVAQVYQHGEYAVRGSLVDVFPMGLDRPLRIDFFDDEIDSLRHFDVDTQLTAETIERLELLPAREFPFDEDAIALFRQQWRQKFDSELGSSELYQDVSDGQTFPGIEYYFPLFFKSVENIFNYISSSSIVITEANNEQVAEQFWHELGERHEQRAYDRVKPILAPSELYLHQNELNELRSAHRHIELRPNAKERSTDAHSFGFTTLPELTVEHRHKDPLQRLRQFIAERSDWRIAIYSESPGRREALKTLLERHELDYREPGPDEQAGILVPSSQSLASHAPTIQVGTIEAGFMRAGEIAVITETELFGEQVRQRRRREASDSQNEDAILNLAELQIGDPVVHIDHGIGRYLGLTRLDAGGMPAEYLCLEYSGEDKLYVPVQSLHLISRYSGLSTDNISWHKLGNETWEKAKKKAAEKIVDVAAELLKVYAERAAKPGIKHQIDAVDYDRFAAGFPFETTNDQENAIQATLADMRSPNHMDRLICGDVGFGKTEVALRAAFVAVQSGQQVAILVPTTLLAEQHLATFLDRFADWPVKVASLSRFKTAKEQREVVAQLASGQMDIVIGTHKLIQPSIKFKRLGLVIIDEEHRFGVRQKEKLKALRAEVDILTLTATPIPRTLNMAMSGMRDLSIIATPPAKRLSIKTFVRAFDKHLIREALLREIMRGGQVYFLHNEVQTIQNMADELTELVPEARIAIAHGQMPERDLERIMRDFYHQRFNLLVCTTIIETGIDIPNANTIIINRADRFGLAQLHQLRGRVGRSHHQAFAYLFVRSVKGLSRDARKRLEAIEELEDLGAGFMLATHDLEIRGAGELLGDDQSGQIEAIGYHLYMEMLERAVADYKDGKVPDVSLRKATVTEINLGIPALLPDAYIGDVGLRLSFYKRISEATTQAQLGQLQIELINRFGLLPQASKNLFELAELKQMLSPLGVEKLDLGRQYLRWQFASDTKIDPGKLIKMIQSAPHLYQLEGSNILKVRVPELALAELLKLIEKLASELQ